MNKIYYLLCALTLAPLAACDSDNTEVVNMQYQDQNPVITVTGVSPAQGYVADKFTVSGTNFGGAKDFVKVFIGENEAAVQSCSAEKIVALVPDGATTGFIRVELLKDKCDTELQYRVLGAPSVERISKTWGFVGDEITFSGSSLGTKAEDIQMYFGKSKTAAPVNSWSDTEFTVIVPDDATTGKIALNVSTQKNVNTPLPETGFEIRKHATLASISASTAYAGSTLTITGTNFGSTAKVMFGDLEGEVQSCSETSITVKVPSTASSGKVDVKVTTAYEDVDGALELTIKALPVITVSPAQGYIGSSVTLTGTNMPAAASDVTVIFGDKAATVTAANYTYTSSNGKGVLKVVVPSGLTAGTVKLKVEIAGLQAYNKDFEVLQTPEVTTKVADGVTRFIRAGKTLTLQGTNLGTESSRVTVKFGSLTATDVTVANTQMTVTVPERFTEGVVTVAFEGVPVQTIGTMKALAVGDISSVILKNYEQPFERVEETATEWATPKDWNSNFNVNDNGGLQYPSKHGDPSESTISLVKWGKKNENGKLWQGATLPAGEYKAKLNVYEVGTSGGRFKVWFIVTKGTALSDIPDLEKPESWNTTLPASVIASYDVTSKKIDKADAYVQEVPFTLTADQTDVVFAFVTQLGNKSWVRLTALHVELVK